jgi:hypothetical protein
MSIHAAKEELASLTPFQHAMHYPVDITEELLSEFHRVFVKSTWYSSIPMKLTCSLDSEEVVYTVNSSFHYLTYTYLHCVLPRISVKPEFKDKVRIAWCHNVGTNQCTRAVFREDDENYHTWDSIWADIYFQFYQEPGAGKRDLHNVGIGNIKALEDWTSDFLPYHTINVDQPWFYSLNTAWAFPIFYKNSLTRAQHRYTFKRSIKQLLRVQLMDKKGIWNDVSKKYYPKLIDAPSFKMPLPQLWGRYAYITDTEIQNNKCCKERVLYTRDVAICDTPNSNVYNTIADVPLECSNPCLAMFWVAENKDASSTNNYSNYTTDTNDLYNGLDPIIHTTLTYGTIPKLDKMTSDHFNIAESRKHFPSAPCDVGYHGYSFAWNSTNFDSDIGIVFHDMKANLKCFISDSPDYSNDSKVIVDDVNEDIEEMIRDTDDEEDKTHNLIATQVHSPDFITRVRLLIVRKFTIREDSETGKFVFQIE